MINIFLNIMVVIILIIYFLVCIIKKISFKFTFILGLITILIAAGLLMIGMEDLTINITTIAYYLFTVSVILALVEYLRDISKTTREKTP